MQVQPLAAPVQMLLLFEASVYKYIAAHVPAQIRVYPRVRASWDFRKADLQERETNSKATEEEIIIHQPYYNPDVIN